MLRRSAYTGAFLVFLAATVLLWNYLSVHRHLATVLDTDPRNKGISAFAHYDLFLQPNTLVFDLRSVSNTNSQADVFRVLLQFAATQKDKEYSTIELRYRGRTKFLLKGYYFRRLGLEYNTQNPVYTMRTLPENVYRPDGTTRFGTWTGGLIGVLGKQMEDFSEFHKQWYINDLALAGS